VRSGGRARRLVSRLTAALTPTQGDLTAALVAMADNSADAVRLLHEWAQGRGGDGEVLRSAAETARTDRRAMAARVTRSLIFPRTPRRSWSSRSAWRR
jgi:hypothetical protein